MRIETGTIAEALNSLTGAPTDFYFHSEHKDLDNLWQVLSSSDKSDFIMGSIVNPNFKGDQETKGDTLD